MPRNYNPVPQFLDDDGDPLALGHMYYYDTGTSKDKVTYSDVNMTIPNTQPVELSASGRLPNVFFSGSARMVLTNADETQIWDVSSVGDDSTQDSFSTWSPLVTYSVNDVVQGSDGALYKSIQSGNINHDPTTSPTYWAGVEFVNIWNTNVTYNISDIAKGSDGFIYRSIIDGNAGNDPTSTTGFWGGTQATIIADGSLTLAKMANMTSQNVIGRNTAGAGPQEEITPAVGRAMWNVDGDLAALDTVGTTEIDDTAVTLAKIQDVNTSVILGRVTAASGVTEMLTPAQARTLLNVEDGATATAHNNLIINGAFDFWQRGTSFAASNTEYYTSDRWKQDFNVTGTAAISQQTGDGIGSALRFHITVNTSGNGTMGIAEALETADCTPYQGRLVTISYKARCGADYSAASTELQVNFREGEGVDESLPPLGNFATTPSNTSDTVNLTTSWVVYSFEITVGASTTQFGLQFWGQPLDTTPGANDWYEIAEVQIRPTSNVLPFTRAGGSIGGELSLCKRYYEKSYNVGVTPGTASDTGRVIGSFTKDASNQNYYNVVHTVSKREAPTISLYNPRTLDDSGNYYNLTDTAALAGTVVLTGEKSFDFRPTASTGVNLGDYYLFHWTADAEL